MQSGICSHPKEQTPLQTPTPIPTAKHSCEEEPQSLVRLRKTICTPPAFWGHCQQQPSCLILLFTLFMLFGSCCKGLSRLFPSQKWCLLKLISPQHEGTSRSLWGGTARAEVKTQLRGWVPVLSAGAETEYPAGGTLTLCAHTNKHSQLHKDRQHPFLTVCTFVHPVSSQTPPTVPDLAFFHCCIHQVAL